MNGGHLLQPDNSSEEHSSEHHRSGRRGQPDACAPCVFRRSAPGRNLRVFQCLLFSLYIGDTSALVVRWRGELTRRNHVGGRRSPDPRVQIPPKKVIKGVANIGHR